MRTILHRLAHLFGMNLGRVYFFTDDRGVQMVGHRCGTCGAIAHPGPVGDLDAMIERARAEHNGASPVPETGAVEGSDKLPANSRAVPETGGREP